MRRGGRAAASRPSARGEPISPAGRIAGCTTAASFLLAGVAFTIAAVGVVMCSQDCRVEPALGGLALFVSVPACSSGVAIGRSVRRRPVDPDGGSGWTWGLAVVFASGVAVAASRLPSLTCSAGDRLDANFALCIDPDGHRYAATSWIWLKWVIVAAGIAIAVSAVRSIRAARLTAALAALAWTIGFAWLLADSLGAGLMH